VAPSRSRAAGAASGFKSIRDSRSAGAPAWAFQHGRLARHPRSSLRISHAASDGLFVPNYRRAGCYPSQIGVVSRRACGRRWARRRCSGITGLRATESALFLGQPQGCALALVKALW